MEYTKIWLSNFTNLLIVFLSIIMFYSCSNKDKENSGSSYPITTDTNDINSNEESNALYYISSPISVYGSDYSFMKILLKTDTYQKELHKRANYLPEICINILYYKLQSSEYKLLFSKRVNIISLDYPIKKEEKARKYILHRVISEDLNEDQLLDIYDNDILYSSDLNGNNLKQITDLNANFISYDKLKDNKLLIIESIPDKNKLKENWLRKVLLYDIDNSQMIENKFNYMIDKAKKIFEPSE